ncbi:MAG TPA: YdgA family protein [Gammaproteobacteria bacterium]|jgi:uncharacterized protein YdgA (DUF945 family)
MKKAVIALVAILVVLLALPLLTGMMTQSRIEERVAALNSNPFVVVEVASYDRGWLGAAAQIELGINPQYFAQMAGGVPAGAAFLEQRLPVQLEIKHGPVIVDGGVQIALSTVVATFDPASPVAVLARDQLGMPYVFQLRGHAPITGGFVFEADIPPVDYGDGTNDFTFSGLRVDGTLRGDHVTSRGNIDSFDFTSAGATAVVEQIRFDMDSEYHVGSFGVGKGEFNIARVVVTSPFAGPDPLFTAQGLRVGGESALEDDGTMRIGANYSVESVTAGTGFRLADAELGIAVADLDAEAMKDYFATIQLVMGQEPAAAPDELLAALVPVLERLLEGGPNLAVDPIRFAMNGEPFSAKFLIEVDPAALPPAPMRNYQDPSLWLAAAIVTAEAEVSKVLAHDLAQQAMRMQLAGSGDPSLTDDDINAQAEAQVGLMLVQLTGMGMLRDTGDRYTTNARFAQGTLTVNGTPVPLGL